jgi:hypothetical protein
MAILKNKRAEKLACRLYRYYRELSWAERECYEKYIWEPKQTKLWNRARFLRESPSSSFDDRVKGYRLTELYFHREMAWNACQYLLVAEDCIKDVIHEFRAAWQDLRSQK